MLEEGILKDDGFMKIWEGENSPNIYILSIKEGESEISFVFPEKVLEEFSKNSSEQVRQKICNMNPTLYGYLEQKGIDFEYVTRVCAQAQITRLERERDYFIDEFNRAKGLIE